MNEIINKIYNRIYNRIHNSHSRTKIVNRRINLNCLKMNYLHSYNCQMCLILTLLCRMIHSIGLILIWAKE